MLDTLTGIWYLSDMNIKEFMEATEGLDPETPIFMLVKVGKFSDDVKTVDVGTTHNGRVILV